jgi:hypothetical protein
LSLMVKRTSVWLFTVFAFASCSRFSESQLIGTWRHEDDDGIGEITLGADHSYRSQQTFKKEFVTPSVIEETGSWRIHRGRLYTDSVVTWSKERSQMSLLLVDVTDDRLRTKDADGKETVVFERFHPPDCVVSSASVTELDLHGAWDFHYHTHDYRYSLASDGHAAISALISGEWSLIRQGEWRLSGGVLTIREKAVHDPSDEQEVKWTVLGIGTDCLSFSDGAAAYALTRASMP